MRSKPSDQIRRDALKVAKAKLDSGCDTCAQGYVPLAEEHGATRRDVLRAGLGSLVGLVGGTSLSIVTASASSDAGESAATDGGHNSPRPPWFTTQEVLQQTTVLGKERNEILKQVHSDLRFPLPAGGAPTVPTSVVRSHLKDGQSMISVGEPIGQDYALAHYGRPDGAVTDILFKKERAASGEVTSLKPIRIRNGSQVREVGVNLAGQSGPVVDAASSDYCYCGTCRYCSDLNGWCAGVCCGACRYAGALWWECFLAICYGCYNGCCNSWSYYCCNCSPY